MKSLIDQMKQDVDRESNGIYLRLKDKEKFRIRFLQELDPSAPGYRESHGLAAYIQVHQNPENFRKQALCTKDYGRCWACEQADGTGADANRWRAKARFYINVLVTAGDVTSVKVLQQSMFEKHVARNILEYAVEYGSLTDRDYKISRSGEQMHNTAYTLTSLDKSDLPADFDELELHDLSKLVRNVPYAEQESYYTASEDDSSSDWS